MMAFADERTATALRLFRWGDVPSAPANGAEQLDQADPPVLGQAPTVGAVSSAGSINPRCLGLPHLHGCGDWRVGRGRCTLEAQGEGSTPARESPCCTYTSWTLVEPSSMKARGQQQRSRSRQRQDCGLAEAKWRCEAGATSPSPGATLLDQWHHVSRLRKIAIPTSRVRACQARGGGQEMLAYKDIPLGGGHRPSERGVARAVPRSPRSRRKFKRSHSPCCPARFLYPDGRAGGEGVERRGLT